MAKKETVEVFVSRAAAGEDPNLYVAINGCSYLLPRGKTSVVPRAVAQELERSRRAQERLDETVSRMSEGGKL